MRPVDANDERKGFEIYLKTGAVKANLIAQKSNPRSNCKLLLSARIEDGIQDPEKSIWFLEKIGGNIDQI